MSDADSLPPGEPIEPPNTEFWEKIRIYLIAKTTVDKPATQSWLSDLGVSPEYLSSQELPEDPELLVSLAAKRCYLSFEPGLNENVTRIRRHWDEYLKNILASGHGSVLEHATFTFAIEGVSRVFTAEMNRHRAGWAISEGSLRYIRKNDFRLTWPPSLNPEPSDSEEDRQRKEATRKIMESAFQTILATYQSLCQLWELDSPSKDFAYRKKVTSLIRRILPLGIATGGVWTGNLRALRHVIALRASPSAEEEVCHVFTRIGKMMIEALPLVFGDFKLISGKFWIPWYPKV
jgi:thymidylate synthase (FAD)